VLYNNGLGADFYKCIDISNIAPVFGGTPGEDRTYCKVFESIGGIIKCMLCIDNFLPNKLTALDY
jgi:hypothetical protein